MIEDLVNVTLLLATVFVGVYVFANMIGSDISGMNKEELPRPDMSQARRLSREGDVEGAMAEYRLCSKSYPDSPDPLFALAVLLRQDKRFEDAAGVYRSINQKFQNHLVTWSKGSELLAELFRTEFHDAAAADYIIESIHKRNPDYRFGYMTEKKSQVGRISLRGKKRASHGHDLSRARSLAKRGDFRNAVDLFKRYAADQPDNWRPLFEAASVLETAGQFDEAITILQGVVRTFGKNDGPWAEAMLRLASLNENELANHEAAKYMLNEIALRVPGTEHASLAKERLRAFG